MLLNDCFVRMARWASYICHSQPIKWTLRLSTFSNYYVVRFEQIAAACVFLNSCWLWMLSVFWGLAVIFLSFASPPTNKIVSFSMPQLYKANKKMLPGNTLLFHAFLLVLKSFKEHKNGHGEITSNDYEQTMSHPKSDMRLFRMNILF